MKDNYKKKKVGLFIATFFLLAPLFIQSQVSFLASNEYGRIFDLVYDQNIENRLYASSMGNHIMVSDDNGATWDVLYSLPSGTVNELRMVNDTHLSFYLSNSNYEAENTIYLFELETQSLTAINRPENNVADYSWVAEYNIYEADTDIMLYNEGYRIGLESFDRVHYSTDGGENWTLVYDEEDFNYIAVNKVLINYNNPNQLFITRNNGSNGVNGGFLVSDDAGSNWTEYYENIHLVGVAVDPFNSNHWIIGSDPGWGVDEAVYQTLDGGANWSQLDIPFDGYWDTGINEIIFHPTNQDEIFILGVNEIIISYDGGVTWTSYVYDSLDTNNYYFGLSATFNPFNDDEMFFTSNWYPHKSTDGGLTLERTYTSFSWVNSVAVSENEGGQDPYLYYSLQEGLVTKNLNDGSETNYGVQGLDYVSGSSSPMYIVDTGQYGRIFSSAENFNGRFLGISTDHGQTFQTFYTGFWDPVLHMQPDPVNTNEVWVSFDVFSGGSTKIIDVTGSDPWSPTIIDIAVPSEGRHYSTWVNPANNQEVLAGIGGEVWSSSDHGTTWSNASNGLTLDSNGEFVFQIINNPNVSDEFVLATSNGVWKSTDGYQTWNQVLATNNVQKVVYDPNNSEVLVAAVTASQYSSSAIHFSTDNGATWTMVPTSELLNTNSSSIAFDFLEDGSGFTAYLATIDLGVISYDVAYETLSIEDPIMDAVEVLMYPNPVSDVMNISFKKGRQVESVVIYNMLGEVVLNNTKSNKVNVSELANGIYLIKISDNKGGNTIKRFIKK